MGMMKKKKLKDDQFIGVQILQGLFFRRRRLLSHLLPLVSAVSGFLLFLFAVLSFISPPITNHHGRHHHLSLNSSVNIDIIEVQMNAKKENVFRVPVGGGIVDRELWTSNESKLFHGCSNAGDKFVAAELNTQSNRYLLIATSGGLNQQRTGITDAVVAAYILNATLVIPKLDQNSYWKDTSNFSEIFDVDWFMTFLSKDVKIIKQLPESVVKVITTRVPRKCTPKCYETRILPIFNKKHVQAVQLTKFDYRLSNRLNTELQKLRCRVNYHALKFTDPILEMGRKLVERMRLKSKHFVALHLRFESDMLAFSGCYYGGGEGEMKDFGVIRKRWKTLHMKNPDKERRQGRCPLTPEEVGLMLRALGFGNDVHIYVASGEIYGGEETLAPLRALFPNLHSKETIASKEELAALSSYSSRMAALDFIVCDESDVFSTNNNGNMARMLSGRRRYFGHKPTIRPNAKKLYKLFLNRDNMTWEEFALQVRKFQIGFMGEPNEVQLGRGEFHENPFPCICKNSEASAAENISSQSWGSVSDELFSEDDELYSSELDYVEDGI
ncbi:O-fucosyltransferase 6-like isoform X2 [Olea europaea var. sylvestris]|uniref:O-fucosyltransferase 6-like isoform X2 n=1 Tax=Olea europaea var. sylvestris TaxID=158386 RepID=UPI000C1D761D|nr:O-fucosyltransferase 6-like isoform X2 [Olea europaea var. sylvestris]